MVIDALFPAHFPALALAHFVALLSPGPDFFLLAAALLNKSELADRMTPSATPVIRS